MKRRLKALKKIQLEATKIEAKFYEEIHALECKYHELYNPLYAKRTKITKGEFSYISDLRSLLQGAPSGSGLHFVDMELKFAL